MTDECCSNNNFRSGFPIRGEEMAGPTLKQDLQAQEAREAQAQFDADSRRGLENIYREYPELVHCVANEGQIADYCDPMSIGLSAFQLAMDNPTFRKSLAWAP